MACDCCDSPALVASIGARGSIFVPNVFYPGNSISHQARKLVVFGNPQIKKIHEFKVFDTNNNLVYEQYDYDYNDTVNAFNGVVNGDTLVAQYEYTITAESIDGTIEQFTGMTCCVPCGTIYSDYTELTCIHYCQDGAQHNGVGGYDLSFPNVVDFDTSCFE